MVKTKFNNKILIIEYNNSYKDYLIRYNITKISNKEIFVNNKDVIISNNREEE